MQALPQYVYTNQPLIAILREIGASLNPASAPAATRWGFGAFAAAEAYENWATTTGWFGH